MATLKGDGKAFLAIFVGAMIAIVFLISISDSVFEQRNVRTYTNSSVTSAATNLTLDLEGRTLVSVLEIYNETQASCVDLGCNVQTATGSDGLRTVQLVINDTGTAGFASSTINITYTAEPDGYLASSSSRAVQGAVIIFGALAILVIVLVILLQAGSLGELVKGKLVRK